MGVKVRQQVKGKGNPWWVFISHNRKRTSRKVGDKKAAEVVASTIRAKLQLGEFGFKDKKTVPAFGEYSKKWVQGYVKVHLRESTLEEYEGILKNHVLSAFRNERLDQITRGEIRDFLLEKYSGGLSRKRVMMLKDVLSGVFNYAIDEELIKTNPITGITKRLFPKNGHNKWQVGKDDVFTKKELELFLNTCKADFTEYYPFFLMAARTGMRLGELLAVRWEDVDLKNNYIWVRRSYRRGRFTMPKNSKSRKVDMSDQLADVLRENLKNGFKDVTELVHKKHGQVMEQNYIRNQYKRILKKAKLKYIKLHGIRHAFCAHLLSEGVSPYYVSQQVGHSSINITCDTYGSWIRTEENRHVNLLDPQQSSDPICPNVKEVSIAAY